MNAPQNGNAIGFFPNNYYINNANMNNNPNFMNQNMMMMNNQNMMMNNQNMMMNNQNMMMMNNPNMMMNNPNMMMNNQNMMMNNPNMMMNNQNMMMNNQNNFNEIKEEDKIEIKFSIVNGPTVSYFGNKKLAFKDNLKLLCQKMNWEEKDLEERIRFIQGSRLLDLNSDTPLENLFKGKIQNINVYDDQEIIGT